MPLCSRRFATLLACVLVIAGTVAMFYCGRATPVPSSDRLAYWRQRGIDLINVAAMRRTAETPEVRQSLEKSHPEELRALFSSHRVRIEDIIAVLNEYPTIQHLSLVGSQTNDDDVARLVRFTALTSIDFAATNVTDECIVALNTMSGIESLSFDYTALGNKGLVGLTRLPSLKSVSLLGTRCTLDSVERYRDIAPDTNVTFALSRSPDDSNAVRQLLQHGVRVIESPVEAAVGGRPGRHLYFPGNIAMFSMAGNTSVEPGWAQWIGSVEDVTSINMSLSDGGSIEPDYELIEALSQMTDIRKLRLARWPYVSDTVIGVSGLPHLAVLDLSYSGINSEDLDILAECRSLTELSILGSTVSNASVADFVGRASLTDLTVGGDHLTGTIMEEFPQHTDLRRVTLELPEKERARFEESRRNSASGIQVDVYWIE